ncbi:nucleotide exchange factor GrpE [Microbacterium sp. NIBRBAC000506063]|uniref:nucleotide exchange factor GrpE n=1 Tax=Microbacterium sp. NIBRBAC000506063 TaxID=2734618 RepID=UPI001BB659E0|nr:nucleotide exchange factor GrpE [Microbacterium sp. NIBRBAC000506063]QTV78956.1 nucleotide exchange factor GrpE [Microbacterium sp. NIBRBAC000506063]
MTDKNFDENDVPEETPEEEHPPVVERDEDESKRGDDAETSDAADSESAASDPAAASDDELTVDDILGTAQTGEAAAEDAVLADLESQLLDDLKRLQAEYANYRRRTEEQRTVEIQRAKGEVVKGLLPVLDDIDRAAQHGDLEEGSAFAVIGEKVRGVVERMGVEKYGEAGEPFDPQHHEAILQHPVPGTEQPTILEVVEVGYRLGDVELRPAKVVVAVPAE